MIKIGIVGGAGYTGGELLRLLVHHPEVNIVFVHSSSQAGKRVDAVHTDLIGDTDLNFTNTLSAEIDALFLCVGHGDAKKFLEANVVPESVKIIDLSQDFRLNQHSTLGNRTFVYGLPELNKERLKTAQNSANPGCFATCIQLGLLPLASKNLLQTEVHINATTGSTGAGQAHSNTTHFSWRNNNLSVYKTFEHQHLAEIGQSLTQVQNGFNKALNFIPQRGDFTRGILAAMYVESSLSIEEAYALYENYYQGAAFTHISKVNIDLKQVVNTNKCIIHLEKHGNKLIIVSILDNLLKGASGQAVQTMNLMFGLDEKTSLNLKANAF